MKKGKSKKVVEKKAVQLELIYMTPNIVTLKEIGDYLSDNGIGIERWEEMDVLQIVGQSDGGIDIEAVENDFEHPSDMAFIQNNGVQTIYYINAVEDEFNSSKDVLCKILERFGGFICTDSEDFNPIYHLADLS